MDAIDVETIRMLAGVADIEIPPARHAMLARRLGSMMGATLKLRSMMRQVPIVVPFTTSAQISSESTPE